MSCQNPETGSATLKSAPPQNQNTCRKHQLLAGFPRRAPNRRRREKRARSTNYRQSPSLESPFLGGISNDARSVLRAGRARPFGQQAPNRRRKPQRREARVPNPRSGTPPLCLARSASARRPPLRGATRRRRLPGRNRRRAPPGPDGGGARAYPQARLQRGNGNRGRT